MKKYALNKYHLFAGFSLFLLTACEHLPDVMGKGQEKTGHTQSNTEPAQASAESAEMMRKNGNSLIDGGKYQEAIEVFDKLIIRDPKNALAYNGKAVAFDYSGNHLAAQELYKTAVSLSPDSVLIKNNLAMSMILNSQMEQAIKLLESLAKNIKDGNPMSHIVRHNLALAYGLSGQYEKATKLNRRDMSKKQAEENVRFYKAYTARNGAKSFSSKFKEKNYKQDLSSRAGGHIGFVSPSIVAGKPEAAAKEPEKSFSKQSEKTIEPSSDGVGRTGLSALFVGQPISYDYPE